MNIALVCLGHENIGLEYISSALKHSGYQCDLIKVGMSIPEYFFMGNLLNKLPYLSKVKESVIDQIVKNKPDLVGFSIVADTYGWILEIAKGVKAKSDVQVIFGGIHPTSVPEVIIKEDCVDYVCVGEAEEAMVELAEAIKNRQDTLTIKNIWSKHEGVIFKNEVRSLLFDLDKLPFPDKGLFFSDYRKFSDVYSIITGRGCPYRCTFCCNDIMREVYKNKGKYVRRRTVANVIDELMQVKEKYSIGHVLFADDLFTLDKKWLHTFSVEYRKYINLPFTCEVHPAHLDVEIVQLLEDAGCATAGFGLQTISESIRQDVLRRFETNQEIAKAIELFTKSKIYLYVDVLFGLPGQDSTELLETAKFLHVYKSDMVLPFGLRYYAKTEIVNVAKEQGIISEQDIYDLDHQKSAKPFKIGGAFFKDKELNKLVTLVLVSKSLPRFVFDFIVEKKLYQYTVTLTNLIFHLYCLLSDFLKNILKGKRKFRYFPLLKQAKFYLFFKVKLFSR